MGQHASQLPPEATLPTGEEQECTTDRHKSLGDPAGAQSAAQRDLLWIEQQPLLGYGMLRADPSGYSHL